MPRKAADPAAESSDPPRRSSRIQKQVVVPVEKAPPKRRAKKADTGQEGIPKASRGQKRKAEEEANGVKDDAEAPAEKKVHYFSPIVGGTTISETFDV